MFLSIYRLDKKFPARREVLWKRLASIIVSPISTGEERQAKRLIEEHTSTLVKLGLSTLQVIAETSIGEYDGLTSKG